MHMQTTLTQRLANPTQFMALSARLLPWIAVAAGVLIAVALYLALFVAPPDYQQGQTAKIMYVHVPSAWLAMLGYVLVAVSSFGLLVFRHPQPLAAGLGATAYRTHLTLGPADTVSPLAAPGASITVGDLLP